MFLLANPLLTRQEMHHYKKPARFVDTPYGVGRESNLIKKGRSCKNSIYTFEQFKIKGEVKIIFYVCQPDLEYGFLPRRTAELVDVCSANHLKDERFSYQNGW